MSSEQTQDCLSTAIAAAQLRSLNEKISRSRWKSLRASGINDICDRRLYYYRTCGELANEINADLVAIFEEGKDQEPGVRRYLSELGYEVKKAGFTETWPEYDISGQVDGVIEFGHQRYVVEIKTCSDHAYETLNTVDDFKESMFYRKWYGQIQIYMLLFGLDKGVFILKKKSAKLLKAIEIPLDYEYAEGLLKKAERVNAAIKNGEPPEYLKANPVECQKCPFFGSVCTPPLDFGEMQAIDDAELEKKLERREELKPLSSEYDKLDKSIKERLRDIPIAICGGYHITGKSGVKTIKAQPERTITTWTTKIEKIGNKEVI